MRLVCMPDSLTPVIITVFFDELNTADNPGCLKALLVDRIVDGEVIEPNIFFCWSDQPVRNQRAICSLRPPPHH